MRMKLFLAIEFLSAGPLNLATSLVRHCDYRSALSRRADVPSNLRRFSAVHALTVASNVAFPSLNAS